MSQHSPELDIATMTTTTNTTAAAITANNQKQQQQQQHQQQQEEVPGGHQLHQEQQQQHHHHHQEQQRPFPFERLPREIQFMILERTDLTRCNDWLVTKPPIPRYRCCGACARIGMYNFECSCFEVETPSCTCPVYPRGLFLTSKHMRALAIAVVRTKNRYVITCSVPGMKKFFRHIPVEKSKLIRNLDLTIGWGPSQSSWTNMLESIAERCDLGILSVTVCCEKLTTSVAGKMAALSERPSSTGASWTLKGWLRTDDSWQDFLVESAKKYENFPKIKFGCDMDLVDPSIDCQSYKCLCDGTMGLYDQWPRVYFWSP